MRKYLRPLTTAQSFVGTIVIVTVLSACSSKPVDGPKLSAKAAPIGGYPLTIGATPYITGGYNHGATFAENVAKIYFISQLRHDHRNSQVYEHDLTLQTDRRITFQDGEVFAVTAAPDGGIYYSSNTDEIKEEPFAREQDYRFSRAEIYHSDLYGEEIERLTTSPGFDGEMIYVPARKQLLFTSTRSGTAGLYWLDPTKESHPAVDFQVSKSLQRAPTLSTDGKFLYWIEEPLSTAKERPPQNIVRSNVFGKGRVVVKSVPGIIKGLAVNASGKIAYAWLPKGAEFTQIDLYTPETNCNRTLLKSAMDFSEPQFSLKNENVLIFRGSLKENSVVYRWELPETQGPCLQ